MGAFTPLSAAYAEREMYRSIMRQTTGMARANAKRSFRKARNRVVTLKNS